MANRPQPVTFKKWAPLSRKLQHNLCHHFSFVLLYTYIAYDRLNELAYFVSFRLVIRSIHGTLRTAFSVLPVVPDAVKANPGHRVDAFGKVFH